MFPADEHPFLDAILARPSDDGPRLVYADFLDETGDPLNAARAELVRVQVALSRLPSDHPRRPELADRRTDLLQRHRRTWTAHLVHLGAEFEFRRGVPDAVAIDAATFLRRGEELFDNTQLGIGRSFVRRVRLREPGRVAAELAACPFLARVEELDLCLGDLGNDGLTLLVRSPYLQAIRVLDLGSNGLDDAGMGVLARAATLPRLQSLTLNDNRQITGDGVAVLADSPFFAGLLELDLSGNDVGEAGVRVVVRGRAMARLHTLKLAGCHVGDPGIAALVRSEIFRRVLARNSHLDLRKNTIGPAGADALASHPELVRVVNLDLGENYLGDRGVTILAESGRLGNVRTLRLARNQLADAGAVALIAAGLPKLRALDVAGNRLSPRGVDVLKAAARVRGFALDASGNGTEPAAPVPVAVADVVPRVLTSLIPPQDDIDELKRRVAHPARPNR
ncbi:MAG: hypothetical protein JWO38_2622 [Gemmataceae bacterium]|nr:hypothetical protein [Gemmataceae bacterium]